MYTIDDTTIESIIEEFVRLGELAFYGGDNSCGAAMQSIAAARCLDLNDSATRCQIISELLLSMIAKLDKDLAHMRDFLITPRETYATTTVYGFEVRDIMTVGRLTRTTSYSDRARLQSTAYGPFIRRHQADAIVAFLNDNARELNRLSCFIGADALATTGDASRFGASDDEERLVYIAYPAVIERYRLRLMLGSFFTPSTGDEVKSVRFGFDGQCITRTFNYHDIGREPQQPEKHAGLRLPSRALARGLVQILNSPQA